MEQRTLFIPLALYYNKPAFEDKVPSRGRPADTWEELKEDVEETEEVNMEQTILLEKISVTQTYMIDTLKALIFTSALSHVSTLISPEILLR